MKKLLLISVGGVMVVGLILGLLVYNKAPVCQPGRPESTIATPTVSDKSSRERDPDKSGKESLALPVSRTTCYFTPNRYWFRVNRD